MRTETITTKREDVVIRRMILEPGEAMPWHSDLCRRFSVVVRGDRLAVEYRDSDEKHEVSVFPGMADWDEPTSRVHRGVNTGSGPYEEIVVFFIDSPATDPQPQHL